MSFPPLVLMVSAGLAGVIVVCSHYYRKRRELLDAFEKAFDAPDTVFMDEYSYGDESATRTCWSINGRAGEYAFVFKATEYRKDASVVARLWFALEVHDGPPSRFGGYGFGGENLGSKADQLRLQKLFLRLWPDGSYPPPDKRPERARLFASRSS